jgi:hypothetical protein
MRQPRPGTVPAVAVSLALALMSSGAAARADGERLAILIAGDSEKQEAVADHLTEVAVARLAEVPGRRLLGGIELRRRISDAGVGPPRACVEDPSCLVRIAVSAGAARLVSGTVRADGSTFVVELALRELPSGAMIARARRTAGGVAGLIDGVQSGIDELFRLRAAPVEVRPMATPPGARFGLEATPPPPPARRWPRYLAHGSAGGAILCLTAAGAFGVLADVEPMGETRLAAQTDLERRKGYARTANGFLIGGAVLGALSVATFARFWNEIFD